MSTKNEKHQIKIEKYQKNKQNNEKMRNTKKLRNTGKNRQIKKNL